MLFPEKNIQVIHAYDESLNQASAENLKLSIQLALDGFSFSIFNPENQKYLSVESLNVKNENVQPGNISHLLDAIDANKWLNETFETIHIFYEIQVISLIPESLFNEKDQYSLSGFNFAIPAHHQLKNERLQNLDARLLFHIPDDLEEKLLLKFPGAVFQSHARSLVDSLLLLNKNLPVRKRIYVNVRNSYLDILIIEGKQLLFYNIFRFTSKEDFMYYILFVMDQLNLSSEEVSLQLSGMVDKKSSLFEVAYKYIKTIEFVEPTDAFKFSHVFDDIPLHYYFNLFNAPLCG